jgi:hypothetical protein
MKKMKDIIEKMVKQEIEGILVENERSIREMVRTSLLPQLRVLVREEIRDTLDNLLEKEPATLDRPISVKKDPPAESKAPEIPESTPTPSLNNSAIRNPQSAMEQMGLYLYGIVDGGETVHFGNIGIDGNKVYTIPFADLSAVVHDCTAKPYQSDDPEKVKQWVLTHQQVLDGAAEKFGTVIPMGFDTIICGKEDADPKTNMEKWIEADYDNLILKMSKIRDKAEYGVQIFWETKTMAHMISQESVEINRLRAEIKAKPRGIAYMVRQKLEELLKNEMANRADQCFQEFYEKIKVYVEDLRVEKTKKAEDEGRQMLLNLSCLLPKNQSEELGEVLEEIDNREGFSVRFTGPWPPYSFV